MGFPIRSDFLGFSSFFRVAVDHISLVSMSANMFTTFKVFFIGSISNTP